MIYVALAELAVILILVFAIIARERETDRLLRELNADAMRERQLLLNRIQRPELVPVAERPARAPREQPKDLANLARIGTIVRDAPEEGS